VEALATASSLNVESVRRAFMLSGDLAIVAKTARAEGEAGLANIAIELFRPVRSMLASTAEDIADALRTLGVAALEYKIDGARIQVHKSKDRVRVYSRRLNDVTDACPEVVESVESLPSTRLVLDGEAVALRADGRPHAFQTTMRRFGRRLDVAGLRRALPLTPFYFDCLLLDEENLVDERYEKRVARLHEAVPAELVVPRIVTADLEAARSFSEEAVLAGHEGVMAKALDAPYQAGSRGKAWLKVKSAHTLDLVVLAAEWGSGRRRGWLSNLHLGARDPETGAFVMLGKTFKGMTDEILKWQTERLQELEISRNEWTVRVRPELVVEIAFNDLQKSPHYEGGLALRFARLKAYREDKRVEEADTIDAVRALYEKQTGEKLAPTQTQLSLFGDE
ncbi:MAG TPA: ATP-dependent DNA ligase, partial [Vicinamibacteria bacterium]|nr:ATP-dependent DNA ligase [Vicinamibacteria bacterium]